MPKKYSKLVIIFTVITLILSLIVSPLESSANKNIKVSKASGTYNVTVSSLIVRTGNSTKYKSLGKLKKNNKVQVTGKTSNNWYRITFKGKTGYVSGSYLKAAPKKKTTSSVNVTKASGEYKVTAVALNVRSGANAKDKRIGSLFYGNTVKVTGKTSNNWYRITFKGKTGYVSGSYLKAAPKKKTTSSVNVTKASGEYKVTAVALNVRSGASAKDKKIGSLFYGNKVKVTGKTSNNWYRITFKGKTGYVSGSYLKKITTEKSATSQVVKKKILNVPYLRQRPVLPSGCEATSLTMALNYYGIKVSKETIAKGHPYDNTKLVRNPNWTIKTWGDPSVGYVGDPFSLGYTIYPNALKKQADRYVPSVNATGSSLAALEKYIDQGKPVLVWTTLGYKDVNSRYWNTKNGKRIYAPTPLHNVVMTGYDANYIYVNDPENYGSKNYKVNKKHFEKLYNAMGKRALVIGNGKK